MRCSSKSSARRFVSKTGVQVTERGYSLLHVYKSKVVQLCIRSEGTRDKIQVLVYIDINTNRVQLDTHREGTAFETRVYETTCYLFATLSEKLSFVSLANECFAYHTSIIHQPYYHANVYRDVHAHLSHFTSASFCLGGQQAANAIRRPRYRQIRPIHKANHRASRTTESP